MWNGLESRFLGEIRMARGEIIITIDEFLNELIRVMTEKVKTKNGNVDGLFMPQEQVDWIVASCQKFLEPATSVDQ